MAAGLFLVVISLVALVTAKSYLALLAGIGLVVICWRTLLPVTYQASSDGICQNALWRSRVKPWNEVAEIRIRHQAIELQLRTTNRAGIAKLPIRIPLGNQPWEVRDRLRKLVPHLFAPTEDD